MPEDATRTTSSRALASTGRRRTEHQTASSACSPAATSFVLRGGYARTNDYAFLNIALNIVELVPVRGGDQSQQPGRTRSRCCRRRRRACRPGTEPEPADADRGRRRTSGRRSATSSASKCSGSSRANLALRVGYVGTFGKRPVPDARRQPAAAVHGTSAARRSDRAA